MHFSVGQIQTKNGVFQCVKLIAFYSFSLLLPLSLSLSLSLSISLSLYFSLSLRLSLFLSFFLYTTNFVSVLINLFLYVPVFLNYSFSLCLGLTHISFFLSLSHSVGGYNWKDWTSLLNHEPVRIALDISNSVIYCKDR